MIEVIETFLVGSPNLISSDSINSTYAVVFEDDGETGYFYALDRSLGDKSVLDALHVYDVKSVIDLAKESRFIITWSPDGMKVLLSINENPHAAFNFQERRGYCRNNYPSPNPEFTNHEHEWSDEVLKYFK